MEEKPVPKPTPKPVEEKPVEEKPAEKTTGRIASLRSLFEKHSENIPRPAALYKSEPSSETSSKADSKAKTEAKPQPKPQPTPKQEAKEMTPKTPTTTTTTTTTTISSSPSVSPRLNPPRQIGSHLNNLLAIFQKGAREETEYRPALPRRQSVGGICVKDLASRHERDQTPRQEVRENARRMSIHIGPAKPLKMQEVVIPTIDEDQELEDLQRASETMRQARETAEQKEKQKKAMMEPLDSTKEKQKEQESEMKMKMMDDLAEEIDLGDIDIDINDLDLSGSPLQNDPLLPNLASPVLAPPGSPEGPRTPSIPGSPILHGNSMVVGEDLGMDFDAVVDEMSCALLKKEAEEKASRRQSLQTTGYSLSHIRKSMIMMMMINDDLFIAFRAIAEKATPEVVQSIFLEKSSPQTYLNSFDLMSVLQLLCDSTIVPKDVNMYI